MEINFKINIPAENETEFLAALARVFPRHANEGADAYVKRLVFVQIGRLETQGLALLQQDAMEGEGDLPANTDLQIE